MENGPQRNPYEQARADTIELVADALHRLGMKSTLAALKQDFAEYFISDSPDDAEIVAKHRSILALWSKNNSEQEVMDGSIVPLIKMIAECRTSLEQKKRMEPTVSTELFKEMETLPVNVCNEKAENLDKLHNGNVLCARAISDLLLLTSSADKTIKLTCLETKQMLCEKKFDRPMLHFEPHPMNSNLVLAGNMDGSCVLLDLSNENFESVQEFRDHCKYVVRVVWNTTGTAFMTASYDHFVHVYQKSDNYSYKRVFSYECRGAVESACCLDESTFIVGSRNDASLTCIHLPSPSSPSSSFLITRHSMNENKDDHVSFTPMFISLSPYVSQCGSSILAISTDHPSGRVIFMDVPSFKIIKNLYGIVVDEFSNPSHVWDQQGRVLYCSSDDGTVQVADVVSGQWVGNVQTGQVRNLSFANDKLVCASNHSIQVWKKKVEA